MLKIAQLGQPILWGRTRPVDAEERASSEFRRFVEEMQATLAEAGGVGLAAPQVFDERRVFLAGIHPPREPNGLPGMEVFINPRLLGVSEEKAGRWEGCLSFPELLVYVERPRAIRIAYETLEGEERTLELVDFPARVVQHEYDHLEGILTLDRAATTTDIVKASEIEDVLQAREGK